MKTLEMSDFATGKPHIDLIMLGIAWVLAFINWSFFVGLLSCTASMFVVITKAFELYDRYKKKRRKQ